MKSALLFWILVICASACIPTSLSFLTERDRLTGDLLRSYNRHNKPTIEPMKKLLVTVRFGLQDVASIRIDEKEQFMESSGEITLYWDDELLKWNPKDYGGISILTLPNKQIWFPQMKLMNSVEQASDIGMDSESFVFLQANGSVVWWPDYKWKTICAIDITYFPFDTQICNVTFWNPVQFLEDVVLRTIDEEMYMVHINDSTENNAWLFSKSMVNSDTLYYDNGLSFDNGLSSKIWFTLVLQRKPAYLIWNVLVPSILISLMSLLVFLLPCESGEKISLSITVCLGYSVVLLMISDIVPQTGDKIPLLSKFIVASMAITGISLCLTIFILSIHHHSPKSPVPCWAKRIFLHRVAGLFCMKTKCGSIKPREVEYEIAIVKKCCGDITLPDVLADFLRKKIEDAEADEVIGCNKEQWEELARVIDRLFLIINFLVILITMLYVLAAIIN